MKPGFLKLLRAVIVLGCILGAVTSLLKPQWRESYPNGHVHYVAAWAWRAPEPTYGPVSIVWGRTLLRAGGMLASAALMWWICTHDLRLAEARARAATAAPAA